jgi:hypothetical protein
MNRMLLGIAVAVGLITGCSGPGDPAGTPSSEQVDALPTSSSAHAEATSEDTSTPPDPPATIADEALLEAAVTAYSDAFLDGRSEEAYAMFSRRCQDAITLSYFTGIVAAAQSVYGASLPIRSFTANVSGTIALVTYTYDVPAINQASEPWVLEDGAWKLDQCG